MWLEAPIEETDKKTGITKRSYENKENQRGTPQGSPISPLLSNIYMCLFIKLWKTAGCNKTFGAEIVNYADDFVICCKYGSEYAMKSMRHLMGLLELTVNEEKTQLIKMPEGRFVFLGYEFLQLHSWKMNKKYIGMRPSQKAMKSLREKVHIKTAANMGCLSADIVVKGLNRIIRGWANYFNAGAACKPFENMHRYIAGRFRHWLGRKHKWKTKGYKRFTDDQLCEAFGLINLKDHIPKYS
jgi:hypothetical protein